MKCIIQRVLEASVSVEGEIVGRIGYGLLVLVAVQRRDTDADVAWTAIKLATLRIFPSASGDKAYDQDVSQVGGSILLVSNFTVAAITQKGRRPTLEDAADPATGKMRFEQLVDAVRVIGIPVETGRFQAEMKVSLINDGPSTFIVESPMK